MKLLPVVEETFDVNASAADISAAINNSLSARPGLTSPAHGDPTIYRGKADESGFKIKSGAGNGALNPVISGKIEYLRPDRCRVHVTYSLNKIFLIIIIMLMVEPVFLYFLLKDKVEMQIIMIFMAFLPLSAFLVYMVFNTKFHSNVEPAREFMKKVLSATDASVYSDQHS